MHAELQGDGRHHARRSFGLRVAFLRAAGLALETIGRMAARPGARDLLGGHAGPGLYLWKTVRTVWADEGSRLHTGNFLGPVGGFPGTEIGRGSCRDGG